MSVFKESIVLTRDVAIVTIPEGSSGILPKDSVVTLHQALGSNFTVITAYGNMVRIAGIDADALGKQPLQLDTLLSATDVQAVEKNCWEVMKTVYDPEIPVNIVDLGLVYACRVTRDAQGQHTVHIQMTLTAPGCGMGPILQNDVEKSIQALPEVDAVKVEVVLDPPWSREMMSEVAQVQLGLF
jgi:probable FeS assembly SUF system protein SufT